MERSILKKGETPVEIPSFIKDLHIAASWEVNKKPNIDFDPYFIAILCNEDKKAPDSTYINYYARPVFKTNTEVIVGHFDSEEQETGETFHINLDNIPPDVKYIYFYINIFDATSREQSIEDLEKIFLNIHNEDINKQIASYEIVDRNHKSGILLAEMFRKNKNWQIKFPLKTFNGDTAKLLSQYTPVSSLDNTSQN